MSNKFLAMAFAATALAMVSCGKSEPTDRWDLVEYMAVQEVGKNGWGFYGPDGKIYMSDEFAERPSAVVGGCFSVNESEGLSLYEFGKRPRLLADGLTAVGYVHDGVVPACYPGERICVLNADGSRRFTIMPIDGKEVVMAGEAYSDGLLVVGTSDYKFGYIDVDGNVVIEPKYSSAQSFLEDLAFVTIKETEETQTNYIIDKQGNTVYKMKSDNVGTTLYRYGYIITKDDNGRLAFVDKKGQEVYRCPAGVSYVSEYNDKYIVYGLKDGGMGVMTFDGTSILSPKFHNISLMDYDKFVTSSRAGGVEIYNADGNKIKKIYGYTQAIWANRFGLAVYNEEADYIAFLDRSYQCSNNLKFASVNGDLSCRDVIFSQYEGLEDEKSVGALDVDADDSCAPDSI